MSGQITRNREENTPFNKDSSPYFPFKFIEGAENWKISNPATETEHEINQSAYHLLQLCDGYRTLEEITQELANTYNIEPGKTISLTEPLLKIFTDDGMIWWRKQRMKWWNMPPPLAVLWDLTYKCNLRCHHCVVSAGTPDNEELTLKECHRLIDEIAEFGVQQIIFSGGEPLMRPDFFDIAGHASKKGLTLQIATNGTLITEKTAQQIASLNMHAQVSLDGATPGTHDRFRQQPGTWEKTIKGIEHLTRHGVTITIATVVTTNNINEIPAVYQLSSELGAQTFRILPFVPFGRGRKTKELEVSPQKMQKITQYLNEQRKNGGLPVAPMEFECTLTPKTGALHTLETRIGCDGGIAYCTITPGGEVLPCNYFSGAETENIKNNTFPHIWANSRFLNYFRSLNTTDIKGACQECDWLNTCRGSCIAANFAHGDIFQSNCHCWIADTKKRIIRGR